MQGIASYQDPIATIKTTPYEWMNSVRACYHTQSESCKYIKRVPDLQILDERKNHGFKMLCIKNKRTDEIFFVQRGTSKKTHWLNQNPRSAVGATPKNVVDRVCEAFNDWQKKFGPLSFAVGHSASANFLSTLTVPKIFFNPHLVNLPTRDTLCLALSKDVLTAVSGRRQCEIVGTGGHSMKDFKPYIAAHTTLSDLAPMRFYKPRDWRISEGIVTSAKLEKLDQQLLSLQKQTEQYIKERAHKSSSKSKEHTAERLSLLQTNTYTLTRAFRREETTLLLAKAPDLNPLCSQIEEKEKNIDALVNKKNQKSSDASISHCTKDISRVESELRPLYRNLTEKTLSLFIHSDPEYDQASIENSDDESA